MKYFLGSVLLANGMACSTELGGGQASTPTDNPRPGGFSTDGAVADTGLGSGQSWLETGAGRSSKRKINYGK